MDNSSGCCRADTATGDRFRIGDAHSAGAVGMVMVEAVFLRR